jgi:glycosyltransferase involved in cell wall biosynthesis
MISIVIPAYNYAAYLPEAIESVLSQGVEDIEIVICDDASTDDTPAVAQRYALDPRVRYLCNPVNLGAVDNINYAMGLATGEYVLLLGADDYLEPGALPALLAALESHPECGFVYGRYNLLLGNGSVYPLQHPGWLDYSYFGSRDELAALLSFDCYVNIGTTLFRRSVLQQRAAFFDKSLVSFPSEKFFRATDWDLMLSLSLARVPGAFLNQQISVFRQHQNQASSVNNYAASGVAVMEHLLLLDRYLCEDNLTRFTGQLSEIFALLYGKYSFYLEHAQAVSPDIDRTIRKQFMEICRRFKILLSLDTSSQLPAGLLSILEQAAESAQAAGPLFSVVVATYKRPRLLQDALASILDQTCQDFEILVVNDGGDLVENTLDWLGRDPRITYIRQANRGPSGARNAALKLARGRYIVYLDDDDLMLGNHLEVLKSAFEVTPDAVVYTDAVMVLESLEGGLRREKERKNPYPHELYDKVRLQVANYIPINTFSHARRWLDIVGMYDESLHALEDWDLLIRLSRATSFIHVRKTTVEIRQRMVKDDHQTARENSRMRDLFKLIYARYDDLDNTWIRAGRAAVLAAKHPSQASLVSIGYQQWLNDHSLREVDAEILATRMLSRWRNRPLLTMLMKVSRQDMDSLGVTIQSLQQQLYQSWRLIIIADFPPPAPIFTSTELLGWREVASLDDPEQFVQALNNVVTDLPGDWIGLIPPGTELTPECLLRTADALETQPSLVALYSDHDLAQLPGCYTDPQFKPDFNLEYLLSWDYIGAACWFNQQSIMNVGGFAAFPGMEGYELLLRLVDTYGDSSVGHLAFPLLHLPKVEAVELADAAHRVAIENHLQRLERPGEVIAGAKPDIYKVVYPLQGEPLVSIVIPNRDKLEFLQPCIETLLGKTRYQNFEIVIVDNQSQDPDALEYYQVLQESLPERVRVVSYDAPFNFSAQCNLGAREARGEYLLLLNNDIEVVQPEWLERMLMQAQRPEVGVVGAKLVYPETGKVQHGGILLGNGEPLLAVANHYGMDCKLDDPGYMNRMQCDMYLSAVTAACMLMRREVYQQVGGLTEELGVLFNDVDFCLKVGQQGFKLLWTPYAVLVHHHGMSVNARLADPVEQGRFAERSRQEHDYMFARWMPQLARDTAYNRNLSLRGLPLSIDMGVPYSWDADFTERPKILASAVAGGSGEYRLAQPLVALAKAGLAQICCLRPENGARLIKPLEIERMRPDVLVLQNGISDQNLENLKLQHTYFPDVLKIMTLDDLMTELPEKSSLYRQIKSNFRDARRRLREGLSLVDRLIVSTEPLAAFASEFISDIHIVPNRLSKSAWWNVPTLRRAGAKPRVGWVGAQQHKGDLEILHEVIRATAHEVDWVFMGMWPEGLDDCICEKHPWAAFEDYPLAVARLNLDLALAPLEVNTFNESKSNLRLLEYGAMGWPVVCSDIYPYQTNDAPVKRVENTTEAWLEAIRERVNDLNAAYREGDALRAWVGRDYLLEDHLDEWMLAYSRY